jgi:hypothetical protein
LTTVIAVPAWVSAGCRTTSPARFVRAFASALAVTEKRSSPVALPSIIPCHSIGHLGSEILARYVTTKPVGEVLTCSSDISGTSVSHD